MASPGIVPSFEGVLLEGSLYSNACWVAVHLGATGVPSVLDSSIHVGLVNHVHADAAAGGRQLTDLHNQPIHSILHKYSAVFD